jgi:diaminopimelate epimerase
MSVPFEKWQALGNDYLIVEESSLPWPLTPARVRRLCDSHTGVGADGVLLLAPAEDERYVARLRIFNPDGSEAELSGNGAREAIMYLRHRGWTDRDEFEIETAAGPVRPRITGETTSTVEIGTARTRSDDFPTGPDDGRGELEAGGRTWSFQHVSIGNPQCAIAVESIEALESLDLPALGPGIERNQLFPNRTNVSWYAELEPGLIRARIFERGVGETLSSGTGASGAAVAYHLAGGPAGVRVLLDGGELEVQIDDQLRVTLTGWAVPVYRGELSDEFRKELDETQ